jgi:hypothetical protein
MGSPTETEYHLGWEPEAVKAYFKENLKVGDLVVSVIQSNAGPNLTNYCFMTVSSLTKVRFKLTQPTGHNCIAYSFYYKGISCAEPGGQTRIIPYHDELKTLLFEIGEVNGLKTNFLTDKNILKLNS